MIVQYRKVQDIARDTMAYIAEQIFPGMNLREVRSLCESRMRELGADSFWYWDVGAFVFAGEETALSVSGKDYETADRMIRNEDIITIDLSPQRDMIWGDYARTMIVEDGRVVKDVRDIHNDEWQKGVSAEYTLHREMQEFVRPDMTFEQLFIYMNERIREMGFVNCDFLGNLGHSIVKDKADRVYIERGNRKPLGDVGFFTFEPHIATPGSVYGFKREDIYYFENGLLKCL